MDRNYQIMPHPQKKFGELRLSGTVAPAILSTDYKSPPLVWIEYE
jgi:hypothetical protein